MSNATDHKCPHCGSKVKKPASWMGGVPEKRGAYRVKADAPNPNFGWRYWTGERWLPLVPTRIYALVTGKKFQDNPKLYRNTPTKHAILWERI